MYTLDELAALVGGEASGKTDTPIAGVRPFESAGPGDITLAASARFRDRLADCAASAVIVPLQFESVEKPLLRAANPKAAFARVLQLFYPVRFEPKGISPLASVGRGCRIAEAVTVEPFARIGDDVEIAEGTTVGSGVSIGDGCRVGPDCRLHPNATLYAGVRLGRGVIVHSGAVLGADGFGYVLDGGEQLKIPQAGCVEIHDDVEIGANSCVDRATFGATVLERGVKLDNHVHVGHNCRIGRNTVVVGCVGISGSVVIGENCVLAGQSGVVDHVRIGDNVTVMMKTAVSKDVPSGSVVSGPFGRGHREQLKIEAALRRLPELQKSVAALKAQLEQLLSQQGE